MKTVLMVGRPNSGKTAIFNSLTGESRQVANYSGITVDTVSALIKCSDQKVCESITLVDLPGISGLLPTTVDEAVTVGSLVGLNSELPCYDNILVVVDLDHPEKSIALIVSLLKYFKKEDLSIVVNKADKRAGRPMKAWDRLSTSLDIKLFKFSALKQKPEELIAFIRGGVANSSTVLNKPILLTKAALSLIPFKGQGGRYALADENSVLEEVKNSYLKTRKIREEMASEVCFHADSVRRTKSLDKVLLNPLWGILFFVFIFYLIFHSIYTLSSPMMVFIEGGVTFFGDYVATFITNDTVKSFVVDGIISGVGGVIVFVPQIFILFFLLSLMEQSGYISRAAILTDKVMSIFGLSGKAFLPFMSGFACTVPAIMATRTIMDKRERMATIMVLPFITCSARLPVYVLIIGTFIPEETVLGVLSLQALAFFFLYFLGSIVALVMAKLFRLSFFKGNSTSFIIELPRYQMPLIKMAIRNAFVKSKIFLRKAGTVILGLSIVVWALSTYPKPPHSLLVGKSSGEQASIHLENSAIGYVGKAIAPVIKPLGFDWKLGIGILVAFGARELFVSALGTIYAINDADEHSSTLRERILKDVDPITGEKRYSIATAWSLLLFFVFACQCLSTLAVVRRETGSWAYPAWMLTYMGGLAYLASYIGFNIVSAL